MHLDFDFSRAVSQHSHDKVTFRPITVHLSLSLVLVVWYKIEDLDRSAPCVAYLQCQKWGGVVHSV